MLIEGDKVLYLSSVFLPQPKTLAELNTLPAPFNEEYALYCLMVQYNSGGKCIEDLLLSLPEDESVAQQYFIREVWFAQRWELGERRANILHDPIELAPHESMVLSHHGFAHGRRVEMHIEKILYAAESLRHGALHEADIAALPIFARRHDAAYVLALWRNEPKARLGHEAKGAAMILALEPMYADLGKLDKKEARENIRHAAVLTFLHDEGRQTLERVLPKYAGLSFTQLVEQLSSADIMAVAHVTGGFDEEFAQKHASQLHILELDSRPLFPNITEEEIRSLHVASEIAILADRLDMIETPEAALTRKLLNPHSQTRPFFPELNSDDIPYFLQSLNHVDSTGQPTGQNVNSDVWRTLFELRSLQFDVKTTLFQYPYLDVLYGNTAIQNSIKDAVVPAVLLLTDIGPDILRGDYSFFEEHYAQRRESLREKAERKTLLDHRSYTDILETRLQGLKNEECTIFDYLQMKPVGGRDVSVFKQTMDAVTATIIRDLEVTSSEMNNYQLGEGPILSKPAYTTFDSIGMSPRVI